MPFRLEQAGYIYRDPSTGRIFMRIYYNSSQNTGCQSQMPSSMPNKPPDSWIIAGVHSHPFSGYTESLAVPCNTSNGTVYDDVTYGGLSKNDRNLVETARAPSSDPSKPWRTIPEYVIDNDNIFRGDPGDMSLPTLPKRKWPRRTPTCDIVP